MKKAAVLILYFILFSIGPVLGQQAQLRIVSGVLLSNDGEPLPGVAIKIKGTDRGTVTDMEGWYRIEAPVGAVLVYSFIGFSSYEVTVGMGNSTAPGADNPDLTPTRSGRETSKSSSRQSQRSLPPSQATAPERGVAVLSDSSYSFEVEGQQRLYNNRIMAPISRITLNKKTGKLVLIPSYLARARRPLHRIEFSTAVSRSSVNKLPLLQNQYAQGRNVGGELIARGPSTGEPFSWGPTLTSQGYDPSGHLVPHQHGMQRAQAFNPYDALRAGFATDNRLQLFSQIRDFRLRAGYGHNYSVGILPTNEHGRHAFDFSLHTNQTLVQPKLIFSYSRAKEETPLTGANWAAALGGLYTTPPSFDLLGGVGSSRPWSNAASYLNPDGSPRSFAPGRADHPFWLLHALPDRMHNQKSMYGLELLVQDRIPVKLQYNLLLEQEKSAQLFGIPPGASGAQAARLTDRSIAGTSLSSKLSGTLHINNFYKRLRAEVFGGYTFRYAQEDLLRLDGLGFDAPEAYSLDQAAAQNNLTLAPLRRTHEVFTRAQLYWYTKTGHHLLELMLGNSMYFSNTLTADDGALFLPSISLNANLHELEPLRWGSFLTRLKPYVSFTRNLQEAPLLYNQWHFNSLQLSPSDYRKYYQEQELWAASGLRPEKQHRYEAGLSMTIFGGHIDLIGNYFRNRTDLLILPVFSNGAYQLENSASIVTPGIELSLGSQGYFNNGNWKAGLNFSRSRPFVKEIYTKQAHLPIAGFNSISTSLVAGQPYGVLWGSRYARTDAGELIIGSSGFPLVDPEMGVVGNPNPDWLAGLSAAVEWHNIGFSFVIDAKKGGQVWNGTQQFINYWGTSQLSAEQREITGYVYNGVNQGGAVNQQAVDFYNPSLPLEENRWQRYGEAGVAEDALEDASWLRLNELRLSYSLPPHLLNRVHLQKVKLSLIGHNLFVLTPYSGVDPVGTLFGNQQAVGLDLFNQPNVKSYGLALTINL